MGFLLPTMPEGDGPGDGVLLPVDQAVVRPLRPLRAHVSSVNLEGRGIAESQVSGNKFNIL